MFRVKDRVLSSIRGIGTVNRELAIGFIAVVFDTNPTEEQAYNKVTGEHYDYSADTLTHEKGVKFNKDKTPLRFIDPNFTEEVALVFKLGAEKYGDFNYKKGLNISEVLEALERHTLDLKRGNDIDPESQRHQTAHIAACAQMLFYLLHNKPELDDREKIYK